MASQPMAFGALIAGGLLITSALTGQPLTKVVAGQATTLTSPSGAATLTGGMGASTGLVNPFTGDKRVQSTRIDMGEDFSLAPGDPIGALGLSKLVGTIPSWYSGQPFQWFQLLNEHGGTTPTAAAPQAGKFWYVAEQFNPASSTPGTIYHPGQPVGTFASSGTGIEMGWAAPDGRTLAQSTGNTGDATHGNAPAGQDFATFLHQLGVA